MSRLRERIGHYCSGRFSRLKAHTLHSAADTGSEGGVSESLGMASAVAPPERQAEILKDMGNLYFKKERFGAAIEAYTEAITLCPKVPVYWTNRALCHRKRNVWDLVEADCRKALELDNGSTKAHYMLGLALLQGKHYSNAISQLEKALELGRTGKSGSYMVEEIWQELAKARYSEWEQSASVRQHQQQELKECCTRLLCQEYDKNVQELNDAQPDHMDEGPDGVIDISDDDSTTALSEANFPSERKQTQLLSNQQKISELSKHNGEYQERLQTLSDVFEKASAPDRSAEVGFVL
jgi:tetratricopeptide (TPR) repeat protein